MLRYATGDARNALEQLVDELLVSTEAAREAVVLPGSLVRERSERHIDERRREARIQFGATADFETVLRDHVGRDLAAYRADTERLVSVLLFRERLVRLDEFREDAVDVRVVVFGSLDAASAAVSSLRAGADMTMLAQRAGARPPAAPPPLFRGETGDSELERKLFAASAGEVLEPVSFDASGGATFWQVFKVVRAWTASEAPYAELAPRIDGSLEAFPVTPAEFARWRRRALARHDVRSAGTDKGSIQRRGGE